MISAEVTRRFPKYTLKRAIELGERLESYAIRRLADPHVRIKQAGPSHLRRGHAKHISLSFSLVFVGVEFLNDGEHPVPGSLQSPEHAPVCPLEQFVA